MKLLRATGLVLMVIAASVNAETDIAQKVAPCAACHGEQGQAGSEGFYPRIAGKPAQYLFNQLINFREGRRSHALMSYMVDRQRDAYLMEMSKYFADLDLPYPAPAPIAWSAERLARGEALARRGSASRNLPACAECHGERLTGVAPSVPGLVGLPRDYLLAQFGAWRLGTRRALPPDCMGDIARKMTDEEIGDVAAWLATRPVPADAKPATGRSARLSKTCAP